MHLGAALEAEDELAAARKLYEEAVAIQNTLGEKFQAAQHSLELARLSIVNGKPRDAAATARRAVSFFATEKNVELEAVARASLAEALLALGNVAVARRESARAEVLIAKSQHAYRRSSIAVASARIAAADATAPAAMRALEAALARATQKGWIAQALEIRLAMGEIEKRTNPAAARTRLLALERDARTRGFRLIARRAATLAA